MSQLEGIRRLKKAEEGYDGKKAGRQDGRKAIKAKPFLAFFVLFIFFALLCPLMPSAEIFTYDVKGKRDPFVPLVTKEGRIVAEKKAIERVEDITVDGIMWDPKGKSFAMINGEIVAAGNLVGGFKVVKIDADSITLESGGKEYKISRKE